ncbi:hypothetical protein HCN44_000286 [Aphidius gifuensis]|uniref:lysozyme n=1 Tax=Aphidius gifuensis TaxID=684658 RepID=A0A834XTF5_APHGI|nr:hypothetical protein HCN44_000286 [Aphidius gifuensis]
MQFLALPSLRSSTDSTIQPISYDCLTCLYQTTPGCSNQHRPCLDNRCGPLCITKAYWEDAGKLTINNEKPSDPNASVHCLNDQDCAFNVVKSYTQRFAQDCNNDGVINDEDYVRIHHLGGYGCNGALNSDNERLINTCMNQKKNKNHYSFAGRTFKKE